MGTFTNRQTNIGDSSHIFNKIHLTTLNDGTNEIDVADIANKNNPFQEWVADTEYEVDNVVLYNNIIYKCITENADSEFDETNWDIIGGTGGGDGIYISVSKWKYDTNGRLVPITEQEKEQEYQEATEAISDKVADSLRNNPFNNWVASTEYSVGDVVLHDNKIYKCTTANSDTAFTESNWQMIGGSGSGSGGSLWIYDEEIDMIRPKTVEELTAEDLDVDENTIYKVVEEMCDKVVNSKLMPVSAVLPYTGNVIPDDFMLCDGRAVSRTEYKELFSIIGTTYGEGDGTTTFNLPNYVDKFLQGAGEGDAGESIAAGLPNITASCHLMQAGGSLEPTGAFIANNLSDNATAAHPSVTTPNIVTFDASFSNAIYGNSTTVQPPAYTIYFIIKVKGTINTKYILRNTEYAVGDIRRSLELPKVCYLECTVAGTTSTELVTLTDLEVGDTVQDGTTEWEIKQEAQTILSDGIAVGFVASIAHNGTIPTGWLECNGASVLRTMYPDLFTAIGTMYGAEDDTHFNLPNLNDNRFVEGSNVAGTEHSAGLPNITGRFASMGNRSGVSLYNSDSDRGAFYGSGGLTGYAETVQGSPTTEGNHQYFNFDASQSNSIYSDSVTTVQPKSLTLKYIIKAFNGQTSDSALVDITQYGNELNSVKNRVYLTDSYNDVNGNWYRVYSDGWIEQGGIIGMGTEASLLTVSFLKPFISNKIVLLINNKDYTGAEQVLYRYSCPGNVTSTSFVKVLSSVSEYVWYACGQGATVE